jgi:hypothetical protein
MQGDFTKLLIEHNESVTWQSVIRNMPRNVLSFATRLTTNSLATPDNLKRWGKRKTGTCPLCGSPHGTLAHIVNFCPVALKQGRFTWRHDSVLRHTLSTLKSLATEGTEIYADLEGHMINGSTIPADILVSSGVGSKPDIVVINRKEKKIALLELTCPLERNIEKANNTKKTKYTELEISLQDKGFKVYLTPFEVGSSGHISNRNIKNIENISKLFKIKIKKSLFQDLSKISLLCTMSIFHAYQEKEWASPPLLSP